MKLAINAVLVTAFSVFSSLQAVIYSPEAYEAFSPDADAANDTYEDALQILDHIIQFSKTGVYRAAAGTGREAPGKGGSTVVWIGNGGGKSYFLTAGHISNALNQPIITHDGTVIQMTDGSEFISDSVADGDFGMLIYNGTVDPSLFGGKPPVLMDLDPNEYYGGHQITRIGCGRLLIGYDSSANPETRNFDSTRLFATSTLTGPTNGLRIRHDSFNHMPGGYDSSKPFDGATARGDSGGPCFIRIAGEDILIGNNSGRIGSSSFATALFRHRDRIDAIVPEGVVTWFSDPPVVHITKRNATGYAIDSGGTAQNLSNVYLWSARSSNRNQQWEEIDRGNGYFTYQKAGTNFSFDGGNRPTHGSNLFLWGTRETNYNQHWRKVAMGGGAYKLIKRNSSNYAIDGGGGGSRRQNVGMWWAGSSHHNLHWIIRPK